MPFGVDAFATGQTKRTVRAINNKNIILPELQLRNKCYHTDVYDIKSPKTFNRSLAKKMQDYKKRLEYVDDRQIVPDSLIREFSDCITQTLTDKMTISQYKEFYKANNLSRARIKEIKFRKSKLISSNNQPA